MKQVYSNNSAAMNMSSHVTVEHLSRWYGQLCAVDDVSFELRQGEVLGFLGPNGAGKSTTMQIISGALAPGSGRVAITGIDLIEDPLAAKANIGYLPEHPPLYRELTVDDYLFYCARLRGIASGKAGAAVMQARQRCGLDQVGRRLIGNLSKGYQQRVGIAQAIIHSPAVVILDEPTVGLDPIQIHEIRQLIRELGTEHSVILSTHILPEVESICDRVQIINQGVLVYSDTISALGRAEQMLRVRLRRPPGADALAAVTGVHTVEQVDEQTWLIGTEAGVDVTDALVEQSVAGGWGLYELTPEGRSLEEVFMRLTAGEEPVHAQAESAA